MSKKYDFYIKVIYGESNFYHYNKQKEKIKVIRANDIYQKCLNSSFPFPLIPRSVKCFYEFCQLQEQFNDEMEAVDVWDKYFIYGKEQLEQYLSLGFAKESPTLETIIKENIDKLEEFEDEFIENCIIYEERIKGLLIDNYCDFLPSESLAKPIEGFPNVYEAKIPKGIYYNQAYNLEHIGYLIDDDVILVFTGGIGRGKTTLAEELFLMKSYDERYDFNYLVNRSSAKEQINIKRVDVQEEEIGKGIIVKTQEVKSFDVSCYQSFDYVNSLNKDKIHLFNCDEVQYAYADSTFNEDTDITYQWLLETIPLENTRHILLGANGKELALNLAKKIPEKTFLIIDADDDFSYVDHFYYYNNISTVFHYIDKSIAKGKKTTYGTGKIENVRKIMEHYKDQVCVRHSKHKPQKPINYDQLSPKEQLQFDKKLLQWEQWEQLQQQTAHHWHKVENGYYFDCPILISTKANDNGINICDPLIENVFSEFYFDWITDYQWFGRVRWQRDTVQTCNFFIRTIQRDNFIQIFEDNQYCQRWKELYDDDGKLKVSEKEALEIYKQNVEELNQMQQFYKLQEATIINKIYREYLKQTKNIKDEEFKINIFNKIYRDILIHEYIFKNNPDITLESANKGITELEWEQKIKAKEEYVNSVIESHLDKELKSKDIKAIAKECKWYRTDGKHILSIDDTIAKLKSLGYEVIKLPKKYEKSTQLYIISK